MPQTASIEQTIQTASKAVGKAWPLYAFVTSNPLAGFEDHHFEEAVRQARQLHNARGLPSPKMLRQAWKSGQIRPDKLQAIFEQYGIELTPEAHLKSLETQAAREQDPLNPTQQLDRLMAKWLMAFMDEGMAEWWMPEREKGFYQAWKGLAPYDKQIPDARQLTTIPDEPLAAVEQVLSAYPADQWEALLMEQLTALPGLTGMIKYRMEEQNRWQQWHPITLTDMLGVRLILAQHLGYDLTPALSGGDNQTNSPLPERLWLMAWEQTYQEDLVSRIKRSLTEDPPSVLHHKQADAQLVFCIDTRSEVIRRHIEQQGPYETFGYAGFFGIPMNYRGYHSNLIRKSCPPILGSAYQVTETCPADQAAKTAKYDRWTSVIKATKQLISTFKNNVPGTFGYVEGAGGFYGISLTLRTLIPKAVYRLGSWLRQSIPNPVEFCFPTIRKASAEPEGPASEAAIPLEEKVSLAKTLFELTGWQNFSRLVVLAGHGSHTANNPFASSLDCGACAGSPGRHNARMLAHICNEPEVRHHLHQQGVTLPDTTYFLAAEHNTTTDAVELFDQDLPATHQPDRDALKQALAQAQEGASRERVQTMRNRSNDGPKEVQKRSTDWAETRPEWGLAGNAAFVIGPRSLTQSLDLGGRCFLHTYDWYTDPQGGALEAIMNGPMVVTQWINNHYYFAGVDNNTFGSGTKVTQNVVGRFGVVQGNGGDLKTGLPLQSLNVDDNHFYHQPLRLMVLIHAPVRIVQDILNRHQEALGKLFDNEWLYLKVMDPEQENQVLSYQAGFAEAEAVTG